VPSIYIMAIGRQIRLVPLALLAIVAEVALILLFLRAGARIDGVALAVSLGYALYGLGLLAYAAMHVAATTRARIAFVLRSALPSILTVILCVSLFTWVRPLFLPEVRSWQSSAILATLFLATYVFMARRLRPRTGIVAMLRDSNLPFARMLAGAWSRD
jgi:uncharacterized membrane protein